ncbi:exo-alpha-sialidase, partial [bacterium]|nr:exo-alpha-sialidase [bacterium]
MKNIIYILITVLAIFLLGLPGELHSYPTGIDFLQVATTLKTLSSPDVFKDLKSLANDNTLFMFSNYESTAVLISSHDGGTSISKEQILTSTYSSLTAEVQNFDSAILDNSLTFMWIGQNNLVKYISSSDEGSSWSPESIISNHTFEVGSTYAYAPKLESLNGIVYSFWFSSDDSQTQEAMTGETIVGNILIKYNRTLSGISDFTQESSLVTTTPPKDLSGNIVLREFSVVSSITRLMCYYLDSSSGKNEIWMSRFSRLTSSNNALTTEMTKRITLTTSNVDNVKAVSHANLIHVFYTLPSSGGNYDLWYKKSLDMNGDAYETDRKLASGIKDFEISPVKENLYVIVIDGLDKMNISVTTDSGNSFSSFYSLVVSSDEAPHIHENRFGFMIPHLSLDDNDVMILKGNADNDGPTVNKVALTDSDELKIIFDDDLDSDYFQQSSDFNINNGYIRVFSKDMTSATVTLDIDPITENSQNLLKVTNVKDNALNETALLENNFNGPVSYPVTAYYGTKETLSSSIYTNNFPSEALYAQTTYLFYNESVQLGTTGNLAMITTSDNGSNFSTKTNLTAANLYTYNSPLFGEFSKSSPIIKDGKIYFIYVEDTTYDVILGKFDLSGTLETTVPIASADAFYFLPEISVSKNYIHCLYRSVDSIDNPTVFKLYYRSVALSDNSLSVEKTVYSSTSSSINIPVFADIASDDTYVYIVYSKFNDNNTDLKVSSVDTSTLNMIRGSNEGITWSSPTGFTAPQYTSIHPWLSINGTEVTLSFIDCDDFLNGNIYRYISTDSGLNFSTAPDMVTPIFYSRLIEKQNRLYSVKVLNSKTYYSFTDSRGNGTVNVYFNDPSQTMGIIYKLNSSYQINFSPSSGQFSDNNGFLLTSSKNTFDDKGTVCIYFQDKVAPNYTGYSIVNANTLRLDFSEELDSTTGTAIGNYTLNPDLTVTGAVLTLESQSVTLTVTPAMNTNSTYNLKIENVKDKSLNVITTVETNIQTPSDFSSQMVSGLSGWISEYRLTFDSGNSNPSTSIINQYLMLSFTKNSNSVNRIFTKKYSLIDKIWESSMSLTPQMSYSQKSQSSSSGSFGAVVFEGKNSSSTPQHYFSITDNQALSFSSPYSLAEVGESHVQYFSSKMYSAYSKIEVDKYNIFFRIFSNYGTVPETEYQVNSQSLYHSYNPKILCYNSNVHIVWEEGAAKQSIYYSSSADSTISFSSASAMTSMSFDHSEPEIIELGDRLFLFYLRKTSVSTNELYVRISEDDGLNWNVESKVDIAVANIVSYEVIGDEISDRIQLVYSGLKSGESNNHIFYKYSPNAVNWSVDAQMSSSNSDSKNPVLAVSNGKLYLFYDDDRNGSREIYYRTNDTVEFLPPSIELYTFPNPAKTEEIISLIKTDSNLLVTPTLKTTIGTQESSVSVSKIKSDTYMGNFNISNSADTFVKVTAVATSPYNNLLTAESNSYISTMQLQGKAISLKHRTFEIKGNYSENGMILLFSNSENISRKVGKSEDSISIYPDNCVLKNTEIYFGPVSNSYLVRLRNGEEEFIMSQKVGCPELSGGKYYIKTDVGNPVINDLKVKSGIFRTVTVNINESGSGIDQKNSNITVRQDKFYPVSNSYDHSSGENFLKFNIPKSVRGDGIVEVFDNVGNVSQKQYNFKAVESALLQFYVYPNPVTTISDIPVVVVAGNEIVTGEIRIYDVRGDLVIKFPLDNTDLESENGGIYTYKILWQGTNRVGRKLANGTYLMKATSRFVA